MLIMEAALSSLITDATSPFRSKLILSEPLCSWIKFRRQSSISRSQARQLQTGQRQAFREAAVFKDIATKLSRSKGWQCVQCFDRTGQTILVWKNWQTKEMSRVDWQQSSPIELIICLSFSLEAAILIREFQYLVAIALGIAIGVIYTTAIRQLSSSNILPSLKTAFLLTHSVFTYVRSCPSKGNSQSLLRFRGEAAGNGWNCFTVLLARSIRQFSGKATLNLFVLSSLTHRTSTLSILILLTSNQNLILQKLCSVRQSSRQPRKSISSTGLWGRQLLRKQTGHSKQGSRGKGLQKQSEWQLRWQLQHSDRE